MIKNRISDSLAQELEAYGHIGRESHRRVGLKNADCDMAEHTQK